MLACYSMTGTLICSNFQMLCFTKIDLLKEAMARVPLCNIFTDYIGGNDVDAACNYFKHRFLSVMEISCWQNVAVRYISTLNSHQTLCALFCG
jgi:guanine nucleotide-binding protein G(i) subunit alpha